MGSGLLKRPRTPADLAAIYLAAHPVGSLHVSFDPTSPAELYGGTWEQIKDRFILAAGGSHAAGSTGGAETHEHALSGPGYAKIAYQNTQSPMYIYNEDHKEANWDTSWKLNVPGGGWVGEQISTYRAVGLGGTTQAGNNLPPYIVAYVWRRVA